MKKSPKPVIGSDTPQPPALNPLTAEQVKTVSGGLNPQPLPPGDRIRD